MVRWPRLHQVDCRGVPASTKQEASPARRTLTAHTQVFFDPQKPYMKNQSKLVQDKMPCSLGPASTWKYILAIGHKLGWRHALFSHSLSLGTGKEDGFPRNWRGSGSKWTTPYWLKGRTGFCSVCLSLAPHRMFNILGPCQVNSGRIPSHVSIQDPPPTFTEAL